MVILVEGKGKKIHTGAWTKYKQPKSHFYQLLYSFRAEFLKQVNKMTIHSQPKAEKFQNNLNS